MAVLKFWLKRRKMLVGKGVRGESSTGKCLGFGKLREEKDPEI